MDETIVTFNVPNLITVTLMAVIGIMALQAVSRLVIRTRNNGG